MLLIFSLLLGDNNLYEAIAGFCGEIWLISDLGGTGAGWSIDVRDEYAAQALVEGILQEISSVPLRDCDSLSARRAMDVGTSNEIAHMLELFQLFAC